MAIPDPCGQYSLPGICTGILKKNQGDTFLFTWPYGEWTLAVTADGRLQNSVNPDQAFKLVLDDAGAVCAITTVGSAGLIRWEKAEHVPPPDDDDEDDGPPPEGCDDDDDEDDGPPPEGCDDDDGDDDGPPPHEGSDEGDGLNLKQHRGSPAFLPGWQALWARSTPPWGASGGRKVLVRKPMCRHGVVSRFRPIPSTNPDVREPEMGFLCQIHAHGSIDGSPYQDDQTVSFWRADASGARVGDVEMVPGLTTAAGANVDWADIENVRSQLEYTYYDVQLVDAGEFEAGTCPNGESKGTGWAVFPCPVLTDKEKEVYLDLGSIPGRGGEGEIDDGEEMLAALEEAGLGRGDMPDYEYLEMLSKKLQPYMQGKVADVTQEEKKADFDAQNYGPPSQWVRTGKQPQPAECGIQARTVAMICRATGIPERRITASVMNDEGAFMSGAMHAVMEVFIEGAGWVLLMWPPCSSPSINFMGTESMFRANPTAPPTMLLAICASCHHGATASAARVADARLLMRDDDKFADPCKPVYSVPISAGLYSVTLSLAMVVNAGVTAAAFPDTDPTGDYALEGAAGLVGQVRVRYS